MRFHPPSLSRPSVSTFGFIKPLSVSLVRYRSRPRDTSAFRAARLADESFARGAIAPGEFLADVRIISRFKRKRRDWCSPFIVWLACAQLLSLVERAAADNAEYNGVNL